MPHSTVRGIDFIYLPYKFTRLPLANQLRIKHHAGLCRRLSLDCDSHIAGMLKRHTFAPVRNVSQSDPCA
jgi:hypothetical protein